MTSGEHKKAPSQASQEAEDSKAQWRHQLATFNEIGKALTSSLDIEVILNTIMEKISELLKPRNWSLLLVDEETNDLKFEIVVGEGSEKIKDLRLKMGEGIAGWVAKEHKPLLVPDVEKDPRFSKKADTLSKFKTKSIVCVPIATRGKSLGAIELINKIEDGLFGEDDLLILNTLADYTAIAIENALFFKQVEELTIIDDLTRLYNSRFLHSRIEYEVERAKRFENDLSMIFLDLDSFKSVNDNYGHMRGSMLLKEVASLIKGLIRNVDMACRYGGDEFIVMMPETSKHNAFLAAEKIRRALSEHRFLESEGLELHLTASFGVACYPVDASNKDELIQMADNAMYKVKNAQKDGVAEA